MYAFTLLPISFASWQPLIAAHSESLCLVLQTRVRQDRGDVIRFLCEDDVQVYVDLLDEGQLPLSAVVAHLSLLKLITPHPVP